MLSAVFIGRLVGGGRRHSPRAAHRSLSRHRCRGPTGVQVGIGARHQLLRHARDRLVRHDDGDLSRARSVPDRFIPGTLNVGHTLADGGAALIYTTIVKVDVLTLFALIAAAVLGAWLGAGVVASWPRQKVQIGMGAALLGAAVLMFMTQMSMFPGGGSARRARPRSSGSASA